MEDPEIQERKISMQSLFVHIGLIIGILFASARLFSSLRDHIREAPYCSTVQEFKQFECDKIYSNVFHTVSLNWTQIAEADARYLTCTGLFLDYF